MPRCLVPACRAADISHHSTFLSEATSWLPASVLLGADGARCSVGKSGFAGHRGLLAHPHSRSLPRHLCSEGLSEGRPGAQAILPLPPSAFVATPSPGCTRPLGRERGSLGPHRQADPQHHLQNARGTAGQATYSPLGSWPVTRGVLDTQGLIKAAASLQSGRQRSVAGHCPSPGDTAEVKPLGHAGDRGPLGSLVWDGSFSYPRGCWD